MHSDPAMPIFVLSIFLILVLGFIMRWLRQPHVVVYILVGILLGPSVFGVIQDQEVLARIGSFGVIFLLFFAGMEITPRRLTENWLISIIGTILQIAVSVGVVALLGSYLNWSWSRIVLLGFVISLSSTAVVLKLLDDWKEANTRVGQDVIGILLVQDILIVPMLIILGFLGGNRPTAHVITLQLIGGIGVIGLTIWLTIKDEIKLPFLKYFGGDHEMQVFASLGICFGMALLTGLTELSAALGAFLAGMVISSAKETHWVHHSLLSIRTIFIAVFFVSIGMLIKLPFLILYWRQISMLILTTFLTNSFINAGILKTLGEDWNVSLYGGSLLSQIGEFSFVVASVGYQMNIIEKMSYQLTIAVISLSLLLSPMWIALTKHITNMASIRLKKA